MKNYSVIPDRAMTFDVIPGVILDIDTKGLDCIIKPDVADIYVSTDSECGTNESFLVRNGEELCVCGKVYISASAQCRVYCLYYKTL